MMKQVRQDLWNGSMPSAVSVASPVKVAGSNRGGNKGSGGTYQVDLKMISNSYDWIISILNHFFGIIFPFRPSLFCTQ